MIKKNQKKNQRKTQQKKPKKTQRRIKKNQRKTSGSTKKNKRACFFLGFLQEKSEKRHTRLGFLCVPVGFSL
jgi:hypothetical protein